MILERQGRRESTPCPEQAEMLCSAGATSQCACVPAQHRGGKHGWWCSETNNLPSHGACNASCRQDQRARPARHSKVVPCPLMNLMLDLYFLNGY